MILANTALLSLLGFDTSKIPENSELSFEFSHLPASWGVFVLIALALALLILSFSLYRRELKSCPLWAKRFLAVLRTATLLLLLAILLGPSVKFTSVRTLRPVVPILRDASESMNIADSYPGSQGQAVARLTGQPADAKVSRADLVNALLSKQTMQALEAKGRPRVFDFADRVVESEPLPQPAKQPDQPSEPATLEFPKLSAKGPTTDLGRAINEGLSERLTSGIVLLTDGQHNGSSDLAEIATQAKQREIPLLIVGLGDPERPRNLQVTDIYADPQVWKNDPFEIQAVLRSQGVGAQPVEVHLVEIIPSQEANGTPTEKELETKNVELSEDGGQVRLSFTHKPETPGQRFYTLRAKPLENETKLDDNQPPAPVQVKVLDDKARVLMIAGGPNWEYRALTKLFMREENIDLSCWLQTLEEGRQQQGDTPITVLPSTQEELFRYDLILLLDPDPSELDETWSQLASRFVKEHSGGLLYMAGPIFGGQFLSHASTKSLSEILPVTFGDLGGMEVQGLLTSHNRPWPMTVVTANIDQPIMRFYSESEENLSRWSKLPGVYWSFPAAEPKPGARVLIEHSDPTLRRRDISRPLLVTGQYGSGRTTYLGFDGTWRWRTAGYDGEFFKRFWIQATRFLMEGRAISGKRRGLIETSRFRYQIGDRVALSARLKKANFDPLEEETVKGTLEIAGEEGTREISFQKMANRPGEYEAAVTASQQGNHTIKIHLPGATATEEALIESSFSVTLPIQETQSTWLDKPGLMELAALSGGRYFDLDQADQLAASVPDRLRRLETPSPLVPLWDTGRVLALLVGLLGLEWALRKGFKLL